MVSKSISEKFGIEKSIRFGMEKNWYKKVSDSVSKQFGIGNSFGIGFVQLLEILGDVSVLKLLGLKTFPFLRWHRIWY